MFPTQNLACSTEMESDLISEAGRGLGGSPLSQRCFILVKVFFRSFGATALFQRLNYLKGEND